MVVASAPHDDEVRGRAVGDASADPKSEHGKVERGSNNPEAELWGIGKSKL